MATMRAVCLERFGGPETLQLKEVQRPHPADGEVLVRIRAASVNPVDYKTRSGKYPGVTRDALPKILGRDIAGTVVSCGPGVTRFKAGDDVYAMLDRDHGGYAEYVAVSEDLCAPKPAKLDYAAAAAVPMAAITAWQGLFDYGDLLPDQRVLIHGGAGGVGHLAIQLAKSLGAQVTTTVRAQDKDFARSLGADRAIDYSQERFEEMVKDMDLVFDLVAGDTQERSWNVLRDGGALISTLGRPSERRALEHHARATSYMAEPNAGELSEITELIDGGKVTPHIAAIFPFEQVAQAQQCLEGKHIQGKIVLRMNS